MFCDGYHAIRVILGSTLDSVLSNNRRFSGETRASSLVRVSAVGGQTMAQPGANALVVGKVALSWVLPTHRLEREPKLSFSKECDLRWSNIVD